MTDVNEKAEPDISTVSLASPPFDNLNADVTIRTCDGVDFYIYRLILREASPVFAEHPSFTSASNSRSSTDVVEVTEDSTIWDHILRICYPIASRTIVPKQLWPLLEAAKKYNMECVREAVRWEMLSPHMLKQESLRVYLLACGFGFPDIAVAAAKASISRPSYDDTSVPELRCVTSAAHFNWAHYRRECVKAATSFAKDHTIFCSDIWSKQVRNWGFASKHGHREPMCPVSEEYTTAFVSSVRQGLGDYMKRSADALAEIPVGSTVRDLKSVAALSRDVVTCHACSEKNAKYNGVAAFVEFYASKVDEAVGSVKLVVDL